jgi:phospholipid/cholesterol/gamma-HCH transport system ATP-binding protein
MHLLLLPGSGHMTADQTNTAEPVIFEHVSKAFGQNEVLRDVSFSVPRGEALCILGRSGTGKSVTLKLMIGLLKADQGKVLIDGEDVSSLDEDGLSRIRRKMGFLFQSAALFDSFSLGDNLALPLHRLDRSKSKDEIRMIVDKALDEVGLKNDKDKLPVALSGGMRKRAGLARALMLKPEILLVDEPSSGLDRITSSEIDELLMKVKTEQHTTLIVVTHDIRGARSIGDRFAILDQGSLVGLGTAEELEKSKNELVREFISES